MEKHCPIIAMLCLLLTVAVLSACAIAQPTATPRPIASPTPSLDVKDITLVTDDGLKIYGHVYRSGGELAVVLAHQREYGADERSWRSFVELIVPQGYTALTFNFRGIGRSEGDINYMESELVRDVSAAIEWLQAEGFQRIACIGSSMGGTACLEAALRYDLEGVAAIAAPMSLGEPTKITVEDLKLLTLPKLFICADNDRYGRLPGCTQLMYDESPEPKKLKFFSETAHGTELFFTQHKEDLRQLLLDFLDSLR
jgi:alpha/beta superfamily hydrolase